jgi:hypothetical protein
MIEKTAAYMLAIGRVPETVRGIVRSSTIYVIRM